MKLVLSRGQQGRRRAFWPILALSVGICGCATYAYSQTLTVKGNITATGDLKSNGTTTLKTLNASTLTASTLNTSALTVSDNITVTGSTNFATINGQALVLGGGSIIAGSSTVGGPTTLNGSLTAVGTVNVKTMQFAKLASGGSLIIPVKTDGGQLSGACTAGQIAIGQGGDGQDGGGWLYYCRLYGKWASVNFENQNVIIRQQKSIDELTANVADLKVIVCTDHPQAKACTASSRGGQP